MKRPTNKTELLRLLGIITYLKKFKPNMSDLINPLRDLLHKNTSFTWEIHHEEALNKALRSYNVNKTISLTVDAHSKNLGAAFLQEGQPIA